MMKQCCRVLGSLRTQHQGLHLPDAAISASFLLVKILGACVGTGEHTDARHFFSNYHFWQKNATTCKTQQEGTIYVCTHSSEIRGLHST